jgi:hypothetical protein
MTNTITAFCNESRSRNEAGCPILATFLFCRKGGKPQHSKTARHCHEPGCRILGAFLFLRLGWETSTLNQHINTNKIMWNQPHD